VSEFGHCRVAGCEEPVDCRLFTPFGSGLFCAEHAADYLARSASKAPQDPDGPVITAFRYGPAYDPPTGLEQRILHA